MRPVPIAVTTGRPCLRGWERRQARAAGAVRTPLGAGGPTGATELCVVQEHPRVHDVDGDPRPSQAAVVVHVVATSGLRRWL